MGMWAFHFITKPDGIGNTSTASHVQLGLEPSFVSGIYVYGVFAVKLNELFRHVSCPCWQPAITKFQSLIFVHDVHREAVMWAAVRTSHGDDDFSSGVASSQIPDSLGNLAQRVGPVDDRRDLPSFNKLLQEVQILLAYRGEQRAELLAQER